VAILVTAGVFVWSMSKSTIVSKITPAQYTEQCTNVTPHLLIDVRTPEEFASERIAGAINISLQTLPKRLSEIPHDIPVVLYCHSGNRSGQATSILSNAGYTNISDMGGILAWTAAGLPTVQ
jgi:phage shock protein E